MGISSNQPTSLVLPVRAPTPCRSSLLLCSPLTSLFSLCSGARQGGHGLPRKLLFASLACWSPSPGPRREPPLQQTLELRTSNLRCLLLRATKSRRSTRGPAARCHGHLKLERRLQPPARSPDSTTSACVCEGTKAQLSHCSCWPQPPSSVPSVAMAAGLCFSAVSSSFAAENVVFFPRFVLPCRGHLTRPLCLWARTVVTGVASGERIHLRDLGSNLARPIFVVVFLVPVCLVYIRFKSARTYNPSSFEPNPV